jgi:hypothetical protein
VPLQQQDGIAGVRMDVLATFSHGKLYKKYPNRNLFNMLGIISESVGIRPVDDTPSCE